MNVFNDDVEAEYTEWRLVSNKTYINYAVLFIIVAPVLSNIKLMLDKNDPEPTVQSEQKSYLQKPIYLAALAVICIAIARRKFVHINGYCSIYQWWRWISIYLTIGNVIVTLSMMIQCKAGYCHYQYPSSKTLQTSDNIFLETFGMWPGNTIINLINNNINTLPILIGIGLVSVTMARVLFSRVTWSFYLPWPWPIYFMLTSIFREAVIGTIFPSLFKAQFEFIAINVLFSSDFFSIALIYATGKFL
jgi:hypothetical protein